MLLYFAVRFATRRNYAVHFRERLGFLPSSFAQNSSRAIWLHAVSVGEVLSLLPLLKLLREQIPSAPIYLSTSTVAGREVAERHAKSIVDGIFYLPFDFGSCVRRVFRRIKPALLVVVETEIWPNLFAVAHYSGTSLALINARISDRTWPTYRRWRKAFSSLLAIPDLVQVQSQTDRSRYTALGVRESVLLVDANLKFDAPQVDAPLNLPTFHAQQVWIAASTVGPNERGSITKHAVDEDEIVIASFQSLAVDFPRLLLILAPRQPARFDEVAAKLIDRNVNFQRRSSMNGDLQLPGVLLLDTLGELARMYPRANAVFVGGSIAPRGGHNIIEPAVSGVPVIVGPHMHNFEAIAQDFLATGSIVQIRSGAELTGAVHRLLVNSEEAQRIGTAARTVVMQKRGVSNRAYERIAPLYFTGSFHRAHSLPVQILLNGLAWIWQKGGHYKRRRDEQYALHQTPPPVPVISIGGIGVGGAGKTPFTIAVARLLQRQGSTPGILTRGYKRKSKQAVVAKMGQLLPVDDTGDEAQIFLRTALSPVGIGADRHETAGLLLKRFPEVRVLLLDDGFQHARLRRNLDVVLIDALDPFSNGRVIPAGRLREPLSALSRANVAVITRCSSDAQFSAISSKLRELAPAAAIFRTDTVSKDWRNAATGEVANLSSHRKAVAFCGLGNPQSFWSTLRALNLSVVKRVAFHDHHQYTFKELTRLATEAGRVGADVLLTTEKDLSNLPPLDLSIEILYLPIELAIREEESFVRLLTSIF